MKPGLAPCEMDGGNEWLTVMIMADCANWKGHGGKEEPGCWDGAQKDEELVPPPPPWGRWVGLAGDQQHSQLSLPAPSAKRHLEKVGFLVSLCCSEITPQPPCSPSAHVVLA